MINEKLLLDKIPDPSDFYKNYWNKRPFLVKNAIDPEFINSLLDENDLAAMSLDEDIRSRIIKAKPEQQIWECEQGPFKEKIFETLGKENWSLLVQNVEHHIPDTAKLLKHFNFSPRWLFDDLMVGYSCVGGSVGPHIDSYHVFLIQGKGTRKWKIGYEPIKNEEYIESLDIKILKNGFEGEEIEVTCGDVLYIPPNFGHEGITTKESITYSIGFLGPSTSELLIQYGLHIEEIEKINKQYSGNNINTDSSSFTINKNEVKNVKNDIIGAINSEYFNQWLIKYFSTPTHLDENDLIFRDDEISLKKFTDTINDGQELYKEENIKLVISELNNNQWIIGFYGNCLKINKDTALLIKELNNGNKINKSNIDNNRESKEILLKLYNNDLINFQ